MKKILLTLTAAAIFFAAPLSPAVADDANELVPVPLLQSEIDPPTEAVKKPRKARKTKVKATAQRTSEPRSRIRVITRKKRR